MPPDDDFGPTTPARHIATEDDERVPERAKRGNPARPERVPTAGHEGATPVDETTWRSHGRLRGTAKGKLDERPAQE